ncbi:MAG: MBL fold metallo-hydrolase [Eubacteriales bacterium]|nr:MBL fold metallo-hydrolase [Eubacteriales bacterium]MDD4326707.1 MBL fold metallo-hydrolase [Eubacteriales bacterium]MDD4716750.1 MBL fold metallo-hydrolase [Eubacteriales bacterium]
MFRICSLFSGSSGNSTFIRMVNKPVSLLIDAGMSGKRIQAAMSLIGEDCASIDAILLTHEHIDHMAGIGVLVRRYKVPLYLSRITWDALQRMPVGVVPDELVNVFEPGDDFCIGDVSVKSFSVSHDSADCVGYSIRSESGSVSFLTDIGEMTPDVMAEISGSSAIFLESNYDRNMLFEGPYPWPLKRRIDGSRGHLSNEDCAQTVGLLLESGTENFILSHLSAENNTPDIAYSTTVSHMSANGARPGKDYKLQIAPRHIPGDPWVI